MARFSSFRLYPEGSLRATAFWFRPPRAFSRSSEMTMSGQSPRRTFSATTLHSPSQIIATGRTMQRSITATSASRCIATAAMAGKRSRRPNILRSPRDWTKGICGTDQSRGRQCTSSRLQPADRTNRVYYGAARFPVACSVQPIMATAGRCDAASGRIRIG